MKNFSDSFEECGFKFSSFYPCYGLAEATLLVTGNERGQSPIIMNIDELKFLNGEIYEIEEIEKEIKTKTMVSSGNFETYQKIKIIGLKNEIIEENLKIGEIYVEMSNITPLGYYNKPELTKEIFFQQINDKKYFKTGDLGFIKVKLIFKKRIINIYLSVEEKKI
jgi:acyl-CoA synthetase (AMP-forming)/AMP-acid ligase II